MEQKSQSESLNRILIGLTGRVDSTVAAYLLKKQGLDVIGVAIAFNESGDQKKLQMGCHLENLDQIKKVANHLEIPLYAVNAHQEYESKILERVVAARLLGKNYGPCFFCNELKMDILLEKAVKLGASKIASAHYAKVTKNQKNGQYFVQQGVDTVNDESHLLSSLRQVHLEKLVLPLGELTKDKVLKIAQSIGLTLPDSRPKETLCFSSNDDIKDYLDYAAPADLRKSGMIMNDYDNSTLGDHAGIHHFHLGQKSVVSLGNNTIIDPQWEVVRIDPYKKAVYLSNSPYTFDHCALMNCCITVKLDVSKPLRAFARISLNRELLPVILFFKNNSRAVLQFDREVAHLTEGTHVTIYNKNSGGARVIGSGTINYLDDFTNVDRVVLYTTEGRFKKKQKSDPWKKEEEKKVEKKDDFKF